MPKSIGFNIPSTNKSLQVSNRVHDSALDGFHRFDHLLEIKTHEVVVHEGDPFGDCFALVQHFRKSISPNSKTTKMSPSFGQTSASTICTIVSFPRRRFKSLISSMKPSTVSFVYLVNESLQRHDLPLRDDFIYFTRAALTDTL